MGKRKPTNKAMKDAINAALTEADYRLKCLEVAAKIKGEEESTYDVANNVYDYIFRMKEREEARKVVNEEGGD
jgi:hypothetical protein